MCQAHSLLGHLTVNSTGGEENCSNLQNLRSLNVDCIYLEHESFFLVNNDLHITFKDEFSSERWVWRVFGWMAGQRVSRLCALRSFKSFLKFFVFEWLLISPSSKCSTKYFLFTIGYKLGRAWQDSEYGGWTVEHYRFDHKNRLPESLSIYYMHPESLPIYYMHPKFANILYACRKFATISYASRKFANMLYASRKFVNILYGSRKFSNILYASRKFVNILYGSGKFSNKVYAHAGKG